MSRDRFHLGSQAADYYTGRAEAEGRGGRISEFPTNVQKGHRAGGLATRRLRGRVPQGAFAAELGRFRLAEAAP